MVIPYPPGGPTDISTRIVMEKAGQILGQPILFDNKGGASGMIGAEYAKNQPADGYTFLATTVAMVAITRHLQPIPFDPDKDFLTVARMSTSWMALAIHPSVPAQTIQEFVAYAKANPGKVNFGSAGLGTITQLFGEMLNLEAGIKMIHVPYKGSAQATNDLLAARSRRSSTRPCCRISRRAGCAGSRSWPTRAGRISPRSRPCASRATARTAARAWYGILAPAGTPAPIVDKMAKAIGEALKSPDVIDRLDKGGAKVTYLDPAAMRAQIDAESKMFADIIKRGDVKAQ